MDLDMLLKDVTALYDVVGKGNMEEAETMIELIAIDIRAAQHRVQLTALRRGWQARLGNFIFRIDWLPRKIGGN